MPNSPEIDFAKHAHSYLGEFIRAADQKAAFLLVAAAGLLGWLATQTTAAEPPAHAWRISVQIVATVGMVLVGVSAFLAVLAVLPRQHRIRTGLIAWSGILATGSSRQYSDAILKLRTDDILREVAGHSFNLAKVLRKKYCLLWMSICAFILGGAATIVLLVLRLLVPPHGLAL